MAKDKKTTTGNGEWSDFERTAMKERAKELKAAKGLGRKSHEAEVLKTIADMPAPDGAIAARIHDLIAEHSPELTSKLRYGMPTYYNKDGKVVCFFQAASKYDTRYSTIGFEDHAHVDEGSMFPVGFGIVELTAADEKRLAELVEKSAG